MCLEIYLGELHGIPLLVKDNIATDTSLGMYVLRPTVWGRILTCGVQGMLTTAGSHALVNSIPKADAPVVAKLRSKGAIILGKANLSEFANYKGDMPAGFSSLGGQTQSAYGPGLFLGDICVSGSSSGCAVGVSAGFAAGAIGTKTHGSIVAPSSRAALYAIKASVGLISRSGIVPLSLTLDSVGPMAKSAYDVALLLGAMTGCGANDSAST
jgi:amidase